MNYSIRELKAIEAAHGTPLDQYAIARLAECQTRNEALNCLAFLRIEAKQKESEL